MAESSIQILENTIQGFCLEFIEHPYLCYTEHGLHALFYARLLNGLPAESRYVWVKGQKVCIVQKEYRTASDLGRSKSQHWDICLIDQSIPADADYDFLPLAGVVEFGLNAGFDHLADDVDRMSHPEANAQVGFIVHLIRTSEPGSKFSARDSSIRAKNLGWPDRSTLNRLKEMDLLRKNIVFYLGNAREPGTKDACLLRIEAGRAVQILAGHAEL